MKFSSYHPVINLIYFVAALSFVICFKHPVFLVISYVVSFFCSVMFKGKKTFVFNLWLLAFAFLYSFIYAYYNHFGVTNIGLTIIGNNITLESWIYGGVTGISAASVLMLLNCFLHVFSADKIIYLLGRISPKLSLFITIIFRSAVIAKIRIKEIRQARYTIGKDFNQGKLSERVTNVVGIISVFVMTMAEWFFEAASSMKSRGYSLKGRSAFSIYRFDNRDRATVLLLCLCIVIMISATLLEQTHIYYNPEIVFNRITTISIAFYIVYFIFLLFPVLIQFNMERRFKTEK